MAISIRPDWQAASTGGIVLQYEGLKIFQEYDFLNGTKSFILTGPDNHERKTITDEYVLSAIAGVKDMLDGARFSRIRHGRDGLLVAETLNGVIGVNETTLQHKGGDITVQWTASGHPDVINGHVESIEAFAAVYDPADTLNRMTVLAARLGTYLRNLFELVTAE